MKRGKFITLEGMDGAGKSTHINTIIVALKAKGHEVVSTREPGGTALGEQLRALLLHEAMHPETESLLMFAARREHIATVILPALQRGAYVVCDRFTDASYAYQCGAKGVDVDKMATLEYWVQQDLQPDTTLLFDVHVAVSVARLASARAPDKFEREDAVFFTKIRESYLMRAKQHPARFVVIDANQTIEIIKQKVEEIISTL